MSGKPVLAALFLIMALELWGFVLMWGTWTGVLMMVLTAPFWGNMAAITQNVRYRRRMDKEHKEKQRALESYKALMEIRGMIYTQGNAVQDPEKWGNHETE